ncbi:MAG: ABC transporter ATP-binding protein [Proteobacteria bacterium]|nr:ABC transporter ATP-binding protein [Pseudomonadota bacterium]
MGADTDMDAPTSIEPATTALDLPLLEAERVGKIYAGGTQALHELTLRIGRGEFVSLLGPSGCGKTTLLRMFAGLEAPSAGRVVVRAAAGGGGEGRRALAMVFQEPTLMPWARAGDNVRLPLELAGMPRAQARRRVAEALELVGLSAFERAWPRELSGGMRMRASLARALVVQPHVLLMDEPFGALDEFTRHKLDGELHELWRTRGLTVVFVTHSIYEAVFLSGRVVVMGARPGRVIADVAIDAPPRREAAWRVSQPFIEHCRVLSEQVARAHRDDA